jgi:hypothetical protein
MPKRDNRREQSYFDGKIKYDEETLQEFQDIISNPATDATHRRRLRSSFFTRQVELMITRYSAGEQPSAMKKAMPAVLAALRAYQEEPGYEAYDFDSVDSYVEALWLVSIAVLLDVEDGILRELLERIDSEGRDALFEKIVAIRVSGRRQTTDLAHPRPYAPLLDAVNAETSQQSKLIDKFLKGYYKGMKDVYWYNSHLGEDAGYFGYWCFELAAVVKGYHIDDKSFADNQYYPADLVNAA